MTAAAAPSEPVSPWRDARRVIDNLILAALYVMAARAGLRLDAVSGFASLVWPPTGIAIAALLLRGNRLWPGIALGALVTNLAAGASIPVSLGIATGNTLEAVVATWALRRIPGFRLSIERLRDVLGLILLAATLSTVISASVGVASLVVGGTVSPARAGDTWLAWWLGDLIGALLVTPVILVWSTVPTNPGRRRTWFEMVALGVAVVVVTGLIFGGPGDLHEGTLGQAYLLFPVLMWAALRFGQRGAATTAFVASAIAIAGTVNGHGPFLRPVVHQSLLALQTFMGIAAGTFLVLGASLSERRRAIRDLRLAITHSDALLGERNLAHQRLITVLDQSPLAMAIAEAPSGNFLFVNEELVRLIGRRPGFAKYADESSGGIEGFHSDGTRLTTDEWPMSKALLHGEVVRNQHVRIRRYDGMEFDAAFNSAPVHDAQGKIIAAVLIFWDVTAQRRAEDALRVAYDTTAAANRAKSDFFAVMSHELRTPLNAIAGYVELMGLGNEGQLTPQQQEYLQRIHRNQRHLLSLIDDVLNFASIEGGRVPLAVKTVRVGEALDEVKSSIEPQLQKRQLTLTRESVADTLIVRADPEKLRQILLNFLANSCKFTEPGGRIAIGAAAEGEFVRIFVRDTGIGIPPAEIERVFEPFFQVERGMTRKYSGVGLGLSIARDLARAMSGDVRIESTPGEGTTVALLLPAD